MDIKERRKRERTDPIYVLGKCDWYTVGCLIYQRNKLSNEYNNYITKVNKILKETKEVLDLQSKEMKRSQNIAKSYEELAIKASDVANNIIEGQTNLILKGLGK